MAKFTDKEVASLKKRLKALKDGVRNDKNGANNASLMEVLSVEPYVSSSSNAFFSISFFTYA